MLVDTAGRWTRLESPGRAGGPCGPTDEPESPERTGRHRGPTDPSASRSGVLVDFAGHRTLARFAWESW